MRRAQAGNASARPEMDVAVIGAGVIGLACAAALAVRGRRVLVIERNDGIAREGTSRNSGVIHAGIYYPATSLKARTCCRGRELLYRRCAERRIPHRKTGKLIVATCEDELATLIELEARARANGVPGLEWVEAGELERRQPGVRGVAALFSPETGIVDPWALALSYQAEAEEGGANLLLRHCVESLVYRDGGWQVGICSIDGGAIETIGASAVVNAAGLASDRVAELAGIDLEASGYRLKYCKGDYFALAPGAPIALEHLVYPVPGGGGLGIHATLDLAGRVRFGPDAHYVSTLEYGVDASKLGAFAESISRYLPAIEAAWLRPEDSGIRTKLVGPDEGFGDFVVEEESTRGLPGLVNCIGIESPGLTAAGAIAERVVQLLDGSDPSIS